MPEETSKVCCGYGTDKVPTKNVTDTLVTLHITEIEILERRIVPTGSGETFLPL